MYIVAIGWAYVILMMAITAGSVAKAVAILVFLGMVPLALFVYAVGGRKRQHSMPVSEKMTEQRDSTDTQPD